jgi:hypothetical protein
MVETLQLVAVPGSSWQFLAVPGSSWQFLAVPGSSWQFLAVPGSSWQCNIQGCETLKSSFRRKNKKRQITISAIVTAQAGLAEPVSLGTTQFGIE